MYLKGICEFVQSGNSFRIFELKIIVDIVVEIATESTHSIEVFLLHFDVN